MAGSADAPSAAVDRADPSAGPDASTETQSGIMLDKKHEEVHTGVAGATLPEVSVVVVAADPALSHPISDSLSETASSANVSVSDAYLPLLFLTYHFLFLTVRPRQLTILASLKHRFPNPHRRRKNLPISIHLA